ncbi:MAG: 2-dehydro-3-deoxygalactonokinase, partial [Steroidobacteraceae bacterium]
MAVGHRRSLRPCGGLLPRDRRRAHSEVDPGEHPVYKEYISDKSPSCAMKQEMCVEDRHVLGDWGTSRLRLALVENGNIVATREGPGIGALTASPAETLAALVSQWLPASKSLHVVLSGMVGSRNGLIETAYAPVPIDFARWSRAAQFTRVHGLHIAIATGLRDDSRAGAPDVMRGEETQIFGALHLDPTLREGSHLFVLPGTHSKWVDVENGLIA